MLWTALLAAVLVHALGPGLLLDPWNPWVALLPFLLFALLAWSVACGDNPPFPWAAGVRSSSSRSPRWTSPLVVGVLAVVPSSWLCSAGLERASGAGSPSRAL